MNQLNLKKTSFLILFLLGMSELSFAQCGTEVPTIIDYCPDQYAEFDLPTDPDIKYSWYDKIAGPDTVAYGYYNHFISPDPYPTGTGAINFFYQKEFSDIGGPLTSSSPNYGGSGPTPDNAVTGTSYEISVNAETSFKLNYITVALHFYYVDPGKSYRLKVQAGTNYSQWYTFNSTQLTSVGSDIYLVKVPVMATATETGVLVEQGNPQTIKVFTSDATTPPAGSSPVDNFGWFNTAMFNPTYTFNTDPGSRVILNYTANPQTISGSPNKVPGLFDWDITTLCPWEEVIANETNTGCCTPVAVVPTVTSSTGTNIVETPFSLTLNSSGPSAGFYYKWYRDGVALGAPAYEGVGKTAVTGDAIGKYTVRVVENVADVDKYSCYKEETIWLQERVLFALADKTDICLGESVSLNAVGATGPSTWTPSTGLSDATVKDPIAIPTTAGVHTYTVTAEVPVGNQIINGTFENGNVGITTSPYYQFVNPAGATTAPNWAEGYPARQQLALGGNGKYTINEYIFFPGWPEWKMCDADHTSGAGKYFYTDASSTSGAAATDRFIWKQTVTVQPNTDYEFAAWFMNFDQNHVTNPTGNPLPELMIYIDDVPLFATSPVFAGTPCLWEKFSAIWNSGALSGNVELKISEVSASNFGNDFALDDISFGAPGTQTHEVSINVTDCFDITASSDLCDGDSATITASIEGGGVFVEWENITTGSSTVTGIKDPSSITTKVKAETGVSTLFRATAKFIFNNMLLNGDFSNGRTGMDIATGGGRFDKLDGCCSNPGTYLNVGFAAASTLNAQFVVKKDHTTGAVNNNYYVGDVRYDGGRYIAYRQTVSGIVAGTEYGFSGWFANIHQEYLKDLALQNQVNHKPATIEIWIGGAKQADFTLERDTAWRNYSALWTAAASGSIDIEIRVANATNPSNNPKGMAMDDLKFGPIYAVTKTDEVTTPNCVLPVELLSFNVTKSSDAIQLTWLTASESNSHYFGIEKSYDGIHFEEIGQVNAAGNSSELVHYSFHDYSFSLETVYYRLKQVDFDGAFSYSSVKSISKSDNSLIVSVYPNPSDDNFTIVVNSNEAVLISLKTLTGVSILETELKSTDHFSFGSELTSGVYLLEVISPNEAQVVKLVKK